MKTLSLRMMSRVVWWLRVGLKVGAKGCFVLGNSEVTREDKCNEKVSSNNKVNGPMVMG